MQPVNFDVKKPQHEASAIAENVTQTQYLCVIIMKKFREVIYVRRFNVTGTCVGHKHYMVDISKKLDEIEKLIEAEHYFTHFSLSNSRGGYGYKES